MRVRGADIPRVLPGDLDGTLLLGRSGEISLERDAPVVRGLVTGPSPVSAFSGERSA